MKDKSIRYVVLELNSSAIGQVRYEPVQKHLFVEFSSNKRQYVYEDVSMDEFVQIINAESIGTYIVKEIIPNKEATEMVT